MADNELKESRKTRYTKMAMRESLIELMQTRPILDISVKELCDKADISRSTFYAHYKDQYALLKELEDETLNSVEDMLKNYDNKRSMYDTIQMLERILKYIADNSLSIQVLVSENGDINFQKKFFRRFAATQKMAKYLAEDDVEKAEYHLVFVVSGSIALLQHWLKNNMNIPIPELAGLLVELIK
ncbi:MAG: TetR/AcrR family transcriptional regulator C-terminal domain-containing protein [Treponema sp.]|jgi:AcrR family transcriptional regulator|nr:TetR/AcrR family transcriptional regulator C-terminal domain-containing protein [Treponema sp.]